VSAVRVFALGFRARCAIASAARDPNGREELLREADHSLSLLAKMRRPWSEADHAMVSAFAHRLRGRNDEALSAMTRAMKGFSALRMKLFAAASRRRYGEWLGGDAGAEAVRAADEALRKEGVKEPAKMVCSVAPAIP
jgi:hypothetical protein